MNAGGARRAAITGLLVVLAHGQFGVDCSAPAGAAHSRRVDQVGTATQTARVYPNGRTLARRYDAIDRLVAVSDTTFGNQTR